MMVMTSKEIFIPVKPTPASRPRVSRYGTYHTKGYADFRSAMNKFFLSLEGDFEPIDKVKFKVELEIICHIPKKPTNPYPRGDVDNYVKGYLDCITYAQLFWADDIQVTELVASKRYQEKGEDYGARVRITQLHSQGDPYGI